MLLFLIITCLLIISLKKQDLIPVIICCQASAILIVCYRMGMEVPLVILVLAVKAIVIPLLLYYIIRKTFVFDQQPSTVPVSGIVVLICALFVAAYLFTRQLHADPFTTAAIFTALAGILLITTRKTLVGQVIGFVVLQNGIFAFTSSLGLRSTYAIELLLAADVLLSVIIMVLAIRMISKKSGTIDIKTFNSLQG